MLHYSRRSARAFLEAARADGVEISALAVPQCCISANVAAILREAGAIAGAGGGDARTKMPCSGRWSVLCGPDWRKRARRFRYMMSSRTVPTRNQPGNRRDGR